MIKTKKQANNSHNKGSVNQFSLIYPLQGYHAPYGDYLEHPKKQIPFVGFTKFSKLMISNVLKEFHKGNIKKKEVIIF